VNQHEIHVAVARVAQHVFQIQRVAVAQAEVVTNPDRAVENVPGGVACPPARSARENVILECSVVLFRGAPSGAELG